MATTRHGGGGAGARLARVWPVAVLLGLPGCAIDNLGAVSGRVIEVDGATIVELRSVGLHLRTTRVDPGLSLGYDRRAYVMVADDDADPPRTGEHLFYVPWPGGDVVARDTRTVGLEVQAAPPELSVSLGVKASTVVSPVADDEDLVLHLEYAPARLEASRLSYCKGTTAC